jgi:SAM-dependent methyltransferase
MDKTIIDSTTDDISVEKIIEKIRENVHRQRMAGEFPADPDIVNRSTSKNYHEDSYNDAIQRDLSYINSNWDIHNTSYFISSHNPYIGRFLVKGRQLVHGEVRRYVDPIISRQTGFNASIVRLLQQSSQTYAELNQKMKEMENSFSRRQSELDQKISENIEKVENEIEIKIEGQIRDHLSELDENIHAKAWLARILEKRVQEGLERKIPQPERPQSTDLNYYRFEERFRGPQDAIKKQQLAFLPFFENCSCVLDIGCGRGEFLEILRDHGIGNTGIDVDPNMVEYCLSRHLPVEQADAISYLENLSEDYVDGIFIDQVVEHLEPGYLVRMLALCYQKLKCGGIIVVETVNPLSLASFINFYLDMSHIKPVHPLTLEFLLESVGFMKNEIKYYSTIPDEVKLQKIPMSDTFSDLECEIFNSYNHNIELLNNLLWGPRDYAVIGKK